MRSGKSTLEAIVPKNSDQKIERFLLLTEDCKIFARGMFYYGTADARQGLSRWEYFDRMDKPEWRDPQ